LGFGKVIDMDRRCFLVLSAGLLIEGRDALASGHNAFCVIRDRGGGYIAQKQIVIHGTAYEASRTEALASAKPQTVLVETPGSYRTVLSDVRSGRLPPGSIAVFDRSRFPEPVIDSLDVKLKRLSIYFNIPETLEQARFIHGPREFQRGLPDDRLAAYLPALKQITAQYREMRAVKIEPRGGLNAADWLKRELDQRGSDELVVIASHVNIYEIEMAAPGDFMSNYPAGQLPLIDGSVYKLEHAKAGGPTVWTVGCETWQLMRGELNLQRAELALTSKISYPESLHVIRELKDGGSVRESINKLQRREWQPQRAPASRPPESGDDHPLPEPPRGVTIVVECIQDKAILTTEKMVA